MKRLISLTWAMLLVLTASCGQAELVTWTLQNVHFDYPDLSCSNSPELCSASGSFTVDTTKGSVTLNELITAPSHDPLDPFAAFQQYGPCDRCISWISTYAGPNAKSIVGFSTINRFSTILLYLPIDIRESSGGETIPIVSTVSQEFRLFGSNTPHPVARYVVAGEITAPAIPEPSTLVLLFALAYRWFGEYAGGWLLSKSDSKKLCMLSEANRS